MCSITGSAGKWQVGLAGFGLLLMAACSGGSGNGGSDANTTLGKGACDFDQVTCNPEAAAGECHFMIAPGTDGQDHAAVQTVLIENLKGNTVCFDAGTFHFDKELSSTESGITIRGSGRDETVLDFSIQTVGANGIAATGDDFVIQDLQVRNTPGDGIRVSGVKNVTFLNVGVFWDAQASLENGAYGLYPVQCTGVVIDKCVVAGARDAGIYVGQSTQIVVRDSEAYGNVAGIEIENSTDAEVYGNNSHDNAGGLLVFNLPELPVQDGKRANLHDNMITNNNAKNFAEIGSIVSKVPVGTGIVVLASDQNEIHNNTITGNVSIGVMILSYTEDVFGSYDDPDFDKYPEGNYVHDNTFSDNGQDPKGLLDALPLPNPLPDLTWGGCVDADKNNSDGALTNCFENNGAAAYLNFDLCGNFENQSEDIDPVTCSHDPLPTDRE